MGRGGWVHVLMGGVHMLLLGFVKMYIVPTRSDLCVFTTRSNDLAYFDGLNEVILSAGLLKPREGVFQEHIEYLLCLTTPVEIVVLGVSFTGGCTWSGGMGSEVVCVGVGGCMWMMCGWVCVCVWVGVCVYVRTWL